MNDPLETPDRRPLVYGVFAVAILVVAAFLFWPGSEEGASDRDMVLTPESMRSQAGEETAAADLSTPTEAMGATDEPTSTGPDAASLTTDSATRLERDAGPVQERSIEEEPVVAEETTPTRSGSTTPRESTTPSAARRTDTSAGVQPGTSGDWVLNVGSFSSRTNADRQVEDLSRQGIDAHVEPSTSGGTTVYRVRVGYFGTSQQAKAYGEWLKRSQELDSWAGPR